MQDGHKQQKNFLVLMEKSFAELNYIMATLSLSLAFTGGGRVSPCLNKFSYEEQSLVIFDCDGVLVDSEQISAEIISSLLSEWNIQMDPITCQSKFHGFTMEAVVKWVNLKYGEVLDQEFLSNCREKTQNDDLTLKKKKYYLGFLHTSAHLAIEFCNRDNIGEYN